MEYGQLINGVLHKAPQILLIDNKVYYNPSPVMYQSKGYFEIVNTPYPLAEEENIENIENIFFTYHYEQQNDKIVKVWTEMAEEEKISLFSPSLEDRVVSLENKINNTMEAIDYLIMEE